MSGSSVTFVPLHYLLSFLFLGAIDVLLTKCGVKAGHWFALHALGNFYISVRPPSISVNGARPCPSHEMPHRLLNSLAPPPLLCRP